MAKGQRVKVNPEEFGEPKTPVAVKPRAQIVSTNCPRCANSRTSPKGIDEIYCPNCRTTFKWS